MRACLLLAVVLLTALLPAATVLAADRTETYTLKHFPAAALVDRPLFQPGGRPLDGFEARPVSAEAALFPGVPLPAGVTAWTIDAARNLIRVTASDVGHEALRQILRLLDVPPRQIMLEVRVLDPTPELLEALPAEPVGTKAIAHVLPGEFAAGAVAAAGTRLPVNNNAPLRLRWPAAGARPAGWTQVLPRLNGDGTITLFVTAAVPRDPRSCRA